MFDSLTPSWASGHAAAWLLTYTLHSTLFLGLACLSSRWLSRRSARLEEAVWRFALVGALATATLQIAAGWQPVAGSWSLDASSRAGAARLEAAPAIPFSREEAASFVPSLPGPAESLTSAPVAEAPLATAATLPRVSWPGLRMALVGFWAMAALLLVARWSWTYLRLQRRLRARPEVVGGGVFSLLRNLEGEAGFDRTVRLTCSSRVPVPVAMGLFSPEVCVPPRALSHLEPAQQESLLAHEMAHLARRDPFWLAFTQLVTCVLFFQPLNWVARRRLRDLSEMLSDQWAVERTGRPLSLARCLAEVAGWSVVSSRSLPVPGMADRPSHLAQRIRRLLDDARSPERRVRPVWLALGMVAALLGVAAVAPGVHAAVVQAEVPSEAAEAAEAAEATEPEEPADAVEPEDEIEYQIEEELAELDEDLAELDALDDLEDLDLDLDIDLDVDSLRDLEDIAKEMSKNAEKMGERIAMSFDAGEMDRFEASMESLEPELERIAAEMEALEPEIERIAEKVARDMEPAIERIAEQVNREMEPEIERISERVAEQMEEIERQMPRAELEKMEKDMERLAERMRPSEEEIRRLEREAEKLHSENGLSQAERDRIEAEVRRLSKEMRPSEEELKAIREVQRRYHDEVRKFMDDHREEIERIQSEAREQARAAQEDMRRRMDSDPELRALRDRQRQEMREQGEKHREKMRSYRDEMRRKAPKPAPRPEPHPRPGHAPKAAPGPAPAPQPAPAPEPPVAI